MDKKTSLINTLKSYIEHLESRFTDDIGFKVIGIFLYGSQNYRMDTEHSDVDAYAIVIPDRKAFTFLQAPINRTVKIGDSQVKVKDLRVFVQELLKSNYSTLELLVTPYRYLPYEDYFTDLFETKVGMHLSKWEDSTLADLIIAWNLSRTVASILGSVNEMKRTVEKTTDKAIKLKNLARIRHCHRIARILMYETYLYMGSYGHRMTQDFTYVISGAYDYDKDIESDEMKDIIDMRHWDPKCLTDDDFQYMTMRAQEMDKTLRNVYEHWRNTTYLNLNNDIGVRQTVTKDLISKWVQKVFVTDWSFQS